jgi:RimJ/RimL family protein N-acetyltransferase
VTDVAIRDVSEDDLSILYAHQLDEEATRMAAFPARDEAAFMAHWTRTMADETVILKTILFRGEVAGNVVSWEHEGRRKVGYWIGRAFWGRGVASSALAAFLAADETRPLYAHVAKHNIASIRVLEKSGFTQIAAARVPAEAGVDAVDELILELRASPPRG